MTKKNQKAVANAPAPPTVLNPDAAVGAEILAEAIVKVSDAATKLLSSPLRRRAIFLLLRDASGVGMDECGRVLDAAADLRRKYVK